MIIGIRLVMNPEMFAHLPVPVGAKAVSPSKPGTQHKPGEGSQQEGKQVQFSCFWEDPSDHVKQDQRSMNAEEKSIEKGIEHARFA